MKYILAANRYILLPTIAPGNYDIIGYNWFDIKEGKYNSCACWSTKEAAIAMYKNRGVKEVEILIRDNIEFIPDGLFNI
jgi:hypothetical protein